MKKINILFPVGILSLVLGMSFASASGARYVATIQGEDLAIASIQANTNAEVNDGKDIVIEKIASNGTITNEKENGTSTKNENKNGTSTKNEKEDDLLNSTSTVNFEINGKEERAKENRGAIISNAAQVHTGNDFHLFVQSIVNENKNIESVSSQDDRVSVTRNVNTKLFGFIPSSIKETVLVVSWGDGTNQVTVSRPWWNFLSKDEVSASTTQAVIETRINNISTGQWKAILDAKTKAQIISEIQNAFLLSASSTSSVITN